MISGAKSVTPAVTELAIVVPLRAVVCYQSFPKNKSRNPELLVSLSLFVPRTKRSQRAAPTPLLPIPPRCTAVLAGLTPEILPIPNRGCRTWRGYSGMAVE